MPEFHKGPHLTPQSLVGRRFKRDTFDGIRVALVGYCPPPTALDQYAPRRVLGQHFIHVSPDSVRILAHGDRRFLSLIHVYGGPVSSATVEELAYYGIEVILAYGLAGGLGTKGLQMGDFYLVRDALAADGTTPNYCGEVIITADNQLAKVALTIWQGSFPDAQIIPVRAATGDAIYREDDAKLDRFRKQGCDIVNLDSAHLYAVARENAEGRTLRAIQIGVISDVVTSGPSAISESTLSAMLAEGAGGLNPLERTGDIVAYYVEHLTPALGY